MKFRVCLLAFTVMSQAARGESAQARGRAYFQDKGCSQCHALGGVGGAKGPALDGVGKRRSKAFIEDHIRNGSLLMPAFGDALTAQEVDDLAEFMHRSTRSLAAVPAP